MLKHAEITEKILKAFYHVYNVLGYGFLEKVYENAMVITLRKMGLKVEPQGTVKMYFEGHEVGLFHADLLVEGCVIAELKAQEALAEADHAQLLNYLKSTDLEVGLLLNFGPKPEAKRKVFSNDRKKSSADDPC